MDYIITSTCVQVALPEWIKDKYLNPIVKSTLRILRGFLKLAPTLRILRGFLKLAYPNHPRLFFFLPSTCGPKGSTPAALYTRLPQVEFKPVLTSVSSHLPALCARTSFGGRWPSPARFFFAVRYRCAHNIECC